MKIFSKFVLAAASAALMSAMAPGTAEAGFPYWCNCKGKATRYVADTYACEVMRPNHPVGVLRNFSYFRKHRCSTTEFTAWRVRACAASKCLPGSPPKS